MNHSPLHTTDSETPPLARDEAAEQYSTVTDLAVRDNEDSTASNPPLSADARSLILSRDGSPGQHHISKGRKGDRFSPEDDAFLVRLKGEGMPWKTIATFFPGRTEGSLQSHYCTKLKRSLPEHCQKPKLEREQKRVRMGSHERFDEEASQQLQCELDWIAGGRTAIGGA